MATDEDIRSICEVIKLIPQGKVATYGQIAEIAGLPRRARLVAWVLRSQTDQQLPWYRVIRADGSIANHANSKVQVKLLQGDVVEVLNGRVDLSRFEWNPDMVSSN